jgi:hypothetical protein
MVMLFLCLGVWIPGLLFPSEISPFPFHGWRHDYFGRSFYPEPLWRLFLIFIACRYLAALMHELGHFGAGANMKRKLDHFLVGPIKITAPGRIALDWKHTTAGQASMWSSPREPKFWQQLLFDAAGIIANLFTAALVVSYQLTTRNQSAFLTMFVLMSVVTGLANLLPGWLSNWVQNTSDGDSIRALIFQKPRRATIFLSDNSGASESNTQVTLDLDRQKDRKVLEQMRPSLETFNASTREYSVALREKRDSDAAKFLEICLAHLDFVDNREEWFLQAVSFLAIRRKRFDLAQQWLEDIPTKTSIPSLRTEAEAAILVGRDQIQEALQKISASEQLVSAMPNGVDRERKLRSLLKWKTEILIETGMAGPSNQTAV